MPIIPQWLYAVIRHDADGNVDYAKLTAEQAEAAGEVKAASDLGAPVMVLQFKKQLGSETWVYERDNMPPEQPQRISNIPQPPLIREYYSRPHYPANDGRTRDYHFVIRNGSYGFTVDTLKQFTDAAKSDYPQLVDGDIRIVRFGGDRIKYTFGIEWTLIDVTVPPTYRNIGDGHPT